MTGNRFRTHTVVLLVLLGLQFVAGMVLNLFIDIPKHHPGTSGGDYYSRSWASLLWALSGGAGWALMVHALLAVVLLLGTFFLFLRALRPAGRGWRWGTGIATIVTLGALFNGLSFLDLNQDFSSMIMASCWLVVVSILVLLLVRSRLQPGGAKVAETA